MLILGGARLVAALLVVACRGPTRSGAAQRTRDSSPLERAPRRIDVEGRRERLPQPELGGRVWALGRDQRLDRVWAATEVHLYVDGIAPPRVVRLEPERAAGDAGPAPRFLPEVALSARDGLVAASGWGLQVHDYRRGVRVYPREADAQKLAPGAP